MKEITVDAVVNSIPQVTAFIDQELEAAECSMKAQMQLDVAIDEIFGNIAQYAYPSAPGTATVRFSLDEAERMAEVTFVDAGIPFDPLARSAPDVSLSAEERQIGGLGIYLVRKTMDAVEYKYEDGHNILTLRKRI
ncbi:MAG: ATP-binding protein [Clostridia bacterium]|nr:ATP-binding protein [Clostridia bacterium]